MSSRLEHLDQRVPDMRQVRARSSLDGRSIVDLREPRAPTVAVVGLGYVGLPTALALATSGCPVVGVDTSQARLRDIRDLKADLLPKDERRLTSLSGSPLLALTTDLRRAATADAVIICVPTPVDEHLAPDLTALRSACAGVVANVTPGQTIILTSTTYVGCTRDLLVDPLRRRGLDAGRHVFVAFSPERIDPGNEVNVQENTPRVLGGVTDECTTRAAAVLGYAAPRLHRVSSPEAAEMVKLYENTFRAVNIAMANEFADTCRELGLSVAEVIDGARTKPYGFMAFAPGPGVGGHCIPCDPHYLLWQLRAKRKGMRVVEAAMESIARRPAQVLDRVRQLLSDEGRSLAGARVLVLGITYKPNVADLRASPAVEILERLIEAGSDAAYSDTRISEVRLGGRVLCSVREPKAATWDLVLLHTRHKGQDLGWLASVPLVLDATYTRPVPNAVAL